MATLKLNKSLARPASAVKRAPVRGIGSRPRPTLSQAQVQREREREAPPRPEGETAQRPQREPAQRPRHEATQRPERGAPQGSERAARERSERVQTQRSEHPTPKRSERAAPKRPERIPPGRQEHVPPRRPGSRPEGAPAPHAAAPRPDDGSMRLSKRMSELGIASRREADEWIARGWVRVDGRVVSELGSRVVAGQHITIDAKAKHQQAQKVTVLLNKPVGYVSGQAEDGYEPAVVLVTPQNQWREDRSGIQFVRDHLRGLAPAGRLDIDSVGLLVLTQDGRVARQLVGEDGEVEKEYLVRVAQAEGTPWSEDRMALLRHGLELDGEALRPAQVEWINRDQLRFVLREGKKRQIRRMCEAVGLQVLGLKRVRIGAVTLGDLPTGHWRYLRADEAFVAPAAPDLPAVTP